MAMSSVARTPNLLDLTSTSAYRQCNPSEAVAWQAVNSHDHGDEEPWEGAQGAGSCWTIPEISTFTGLSQPLVFVGRQVLRMHNQEHPTPLRRRPRPASGAVA